MFRVSLLICLILFAKFSRGDYEDYEDTTETLDCVKRTPDEIYLDLSDMDLRAINKPFASSPTITRLNLAGNRIDSITANALNNLPELHYLDLSGNPITCDDFVLANLHELETLILDGPFPNGIGRFYEDDDYRSPDFTPPVLLPELENLSLQNYQQHEKRLIGYSVRKLAMPNLKQLHLRNNDLTDTDLMKIFSKKSPHNPQIFWHNDELSNLTHLYLDDNQLTSFADIILSNLRHLSINRNEIQNLNATVTMHNLHYLSLVGNEITAINVDFFGKMINLRFLNLAENKIDDFPYYMLSFLTELRNLTLDHNLLSTPVQCVLSELRYLSLNSNKITYIDRHSFWDLLQLTALYLRNNDLQSIGEGAFGNLPALEMLDLSGNKISSLPESWIAPKNFIVELHLDANQFEDISSMSLKKVNGLQYLSIRDNPIKNLTIKSLKTLPDATVIDFASKTTFCKNSLRLWSE